MLTICFDEYKDLLDAKRSKIDPINLTRNDYDHDERYKKTR